MTKSDCYLIRYEERDGTFKTSTFQMDGEAYYMSLPRETEHGSIEDRPDWLTTIVNLGKLGHWTMQPPDPPPDFILWFRTTLDHELIEFEKF